MRWLCFLILAACGGPPQPIHLEWTVTGRVLDAHGAPVPDARVIAIPVEVDDETPAQRHGPTVSVPTDKQGRFSIDPGVDDDRTFLVVRRDGHALSESIHMADVAAQGRTVELRVGPKPVPVTVVVHGTEGRVYWQTGSPGQGGNVPVTSEVTIEDMPPGEVRIGFLSRTCHWEVREVVAEPGLKLHFQAQTPTLHEGTIVDPDGKPIAGAFVLEGCLPKLVAKSGKDGRFSVGGAKLDENSFFLAVAPGYARTWAEPRAQVRIVLVPSVAFKGRVTDTEGRPLIRARVLMLSMDDPPWVTATVEQGHFFFDHGRPKEKGSAIFGVEVQAPGYLPYESDPLPIDEPGVIDLGTLELEKLK